MLMQQQRRRFLDNFSTAIKRPKREPRCVSNFLEVRWPKRDLFLDRVLFLWAVEHLPAASPSLFSTLSCGHKLSAEPNMSLPPSQLQLTTEQIHVPVYHLTRKGAIKTSVCVWRS